MMKNIIIIIVLLGLSACSSGKLTAAEAKEQAEQAIVEPQLTNILENIKKNVVEGKFSMVLDKEISPLTNKKLESLGYKVCRNKDIITINWL